MAVFLESDGWMFLAIARSDGAGLRAFVAAADHINCAIPLEEEIAGAVSRLRAAGLVSEKLGTFHLTPSGDAIFACAGGSPAPPRSQFKVTARELAKLSVPTNPEPYSLDQSLYKAAVAQYSKSMRGN